MSNDDPISELGAMVGDTLFPSGDVKKVRVYWKPIMFFALAYAIINFIMIPEKSIAFYWYFFPSLISGARSPNKKSVLMNSGLSGFVVTAPSMYLFYILEYGGWYHTMDGVGMPLLVIPGLALVAAIVGIIIGLAGYALLRLMESTDSEQGKRKTKSSQHAQGETLDVPPEYYSEFATENALERTKAHEQKDSPRMRFQANAGRIGTWIRVIPILIGTMILIVVASMVVTDQFPNQLQTLAQVEITSFEELGINQSEVLGLFYREVSFFLFIAVSLILVSAIWVIDKILSNHVPTIVIIGIGAVTGFIVGGFIYHVPFILSWFFDRELEGSASFQAALVFAALGALVGVLLAVFNAVIRYKNSGSISRLVMIVFIPIIFSVAYFVWYSTAFGYSGWEVVLNMPKALAGLLQSLLVIVGIIVLIAISLFMISLYARIPRQFYNQVMDGTTDLTIIALLSAWVISLFALGGFAAYLYWDTGMPENTALLVVAALMPAAGVMWISFLQCPNCGRFLKRQKTFDSKDYDYYLCGNCGHNWKYKKPSDGWD